MLEKLFIKNFVLIDSSEITFHEGLNVITGETGSGKSVILSALSFLLGDRADSSIIRQEKEMATVEAIFTLEKGSEVLAILQEAGIEHEDDDVLIIRREMKLLNKSRTFINNQQAHVSTLKKLTPHLIEFSGQHAHLSLLDIDEQRKILDAFAEAQNLVEAFQKSYQEEKSLQAEIEKIESTKAERSQEIERITSQIEEIDEAKLEEDEEDSLYSQVKLLINQEELTEKLRQVLASIEAQSANCSRQKSLLEKLCQIDPSLENIIQSFKTCEAELYEAGYEIQRNLSKLEFHPDTLERSEKRLQVITQLKKKYGATIKDITEYKERLLAKQAQLENLDSELDGLKERLRASSEEVEKLAQKLSEKREAFAKKLSKKVTDEIRSFNMPNAIFEALLTKAERSQFGDEKIEFYLTPNLGEKRQPIKEAASGGELARLHLSLQMVLRDKSKKATILFDEIDANIGGETATLVGQKLQLLGKSQQLITVTHFAQVATFSDSHFRITKFEKQGRTHSTIEELKTTLEKQEELTRMLGGKSLSELLVLK